MSAQIDAEQEHDKRTTGSIQIKPMTTKSAKEKPEQVCDSRRLSVVGYTLLNQDLLFGR